MEKIENINLEFLKLEDYDELKHAMIDTYQSLPDSYWREEQIKTLVEKFPEG